MTIDRTTLVVQAWQSSPAATQAFLRHNVDPGCSCSVVRDITTLEDAEEWCGLEDLPGLIAELNALQPKQEGAE